MSDKTMKNIVQVHAYREADGAYTYHDDDDEGQPTGLTVCVRQYECEQLVDVVEETDYPFYNELGRVSFGARMNDRICELVARFHADVSVETKYADLVEVRHAAA